MTIIKKDGNVYTLQKPNPIVKDQVVWDYEKLVFHNFFWQEINYKQNFSKKDPIKEDPIKEDPIKEDPIKEDPIKEDPIKEDPIKEDPIKEDPIKEDPIKEDPIKEDPIKEDPIKEDPIKEEVKEFDLPYIKYKVLCYCLPARTKVHFDKLYGESWQKTTYGKKFIFPCVIAESSDINLIFWTSDPKKQIEEKSIIYPFSYEVHNTYTNSYDKVPYDEYRWWKISTKTEEKGGWIFNCIPSEDQPDFSD